MSGETRGDTARTQGATPSADQAPPAPATRPVVAGALGFGLLTLVLIGLMTSPA